MAERLEARRLLSAAAAASAALIDSLVDPLTGTAVDTAKWSVTGRGLEHNGPAGYNPPTESAAGVTLGGTASDQYWFGSSLESVGAFSSAQRTIVRVDRVSLAGSGTAWRSSLTLFQPSGGQFLQFSQDVNETGWEYNATSGGGGNGIAAFNDGPANNFGSHQIELVYTPSGGTVANVSIYLDGVLGATVPFGNWDNSVPFQVALTGQARAVGDSVSAVFRNFDADVSQNVITGTSGPDSISIQQDPNHRQLDWTAGSQSGRVVVDDPQGLTIDGNGGTDSVSFDPAGGSPLPALLDLNGAFAFNRLPDIGPGQRVDIGGSSVLVNYSGASPLATVRQYIRTGQIVSSGHQANYDVAEVDSGTSVRLWPTVQGDANLDGSVSFADLLALAQHYNTSPADWSDGDFNHDGSVNFSDLLIIAQDYGSVANLVRNADFSLGSVDFSTAYPWTNDLAPETRYVVGDNPRHFDFQGLSFTDHTSGSGLMLIANGATVPDLTAWQETVAVTPGEWYGFSGWVRSWSDAPGGGAVVAGSPAVAIPDGTPPILQLQINGVVVDTDWVPTSPDPWSRWTATWNSASLDTATIRIIDLNTVPDGNDFALDDLAFSPTTGPQAPKVQDSGFEWPGMTTANGFWYDPPASPWSFTGQAGITKTGTAWLMSNPPDGTNAAFLQADGSISQVISGLHVGARYALQFFAAQRPPTGGSTGINPVLVKVNGQTLLGPTLPPTTAWTEYTTATFVATSPSETISFAGTRPGQDASVFLDEILVMPI